MECHFAQAYADGISFCSSTNCCYAHAAKVVKMSF